MYLRYKKLLTILFAVALAVLALPLQVYAAASGTHTPVEGVTVGVSGATDNSMSNGAVTVTAKGSGGVFGIGASAKTAKITVTNDSGMPGDISFNWTATSVNNLVIDSVTQSGTNGSFKKTLAAGASVTVTITTAKNGTTNKLVMNNFVFTAAKASSDVTFIYDSSLGSVTVAGDAVSSGGVVNIPSSGATLVATPATGVKFLGWTDINGFIITKDQSTTLVPAQDMTVKAVFAKDGGTPWFGVGAATQKSQSSGIFGASKIYYHTVSVSYLFDNLNNAAQYASANSSKYIVLMNSGTLPAGEYTIPAGVTLLVPYDAANTMYTTEVQYTETYTKPTEYRTLTMADGAKLVINGGMSISAMQKYAAGGSTYGGMPVGATGFVRMNSGSSITVNNGGALYAYGYVIGSGAVTAKSGSTVYEGFQIMDFRGGDQSTGMKNRVFPLSQYYVQNIEVPLTLEAGAAEYAYTWMYMSSAAFGSAVKFIGSDAMFKISSGTIKKYYDASTDRLMIEVDGDLSISSVSLSFASGLGTKEISSESYVLGLNGNISVDIKSGTTTVNQDIAMLPGAHMTIGENALVVIGTGKNMYVYDSDQWGTYVHYKNTAVTYVRPLIYSPTREPDKIEITDSNKDTRPVLTDATVLIKGTLDASKGSIYATESGAQITGSEGGKVITVPGDETVTYQLVQQKDPVTYDNIPITPVKLINADASIVETGNGAADIATTYTYTSGKWHCNAERHSYNSTITDPTCSEKGYTTFTCEVCGDSYVDNYVEALGHSWGEWNVTAEPTCAKEGSQTHTCSVCKATETGTLDKLPHTEATVAAKAPTCTEPGKTAGKHCSVCNEVLVKQEVVAALGHSYNAEVTKPTCTEDGYTTHTCATCGHSYTDTPVDARGYHKWSKGKCDCGRVFEFQGISVSLEESLNLNFYVDKVDVADPDTTFYAVLTKEGETEGKTKSVTIAKADWEVYGDQYRFCFPNIPAKEMVDDVTAAVYYGDEIQVTATENVKSYAENAYQMYGEAQPELATALADMLNYGAACQKVFGYKTDELANAGMSADWQQKASGKALTLTDGRKKGNYFYGSTFSAQNTLMFTFYFDFDQNDDGTIEADIGIGEDAYAIVTYYHSDGSVKEKRVEFEDWFDKTATLYGIDVVGIPVISGLKEITCTVYNNNGTVISEGNVDSVVSYTARIDAEKKPDQYDAMVGLLRFVDSAITYFNTKKV